MGLPRQIERVHEIGVFGDYHALLTLREVVDFCVSCAITVWEIECMESVMPCFA